MKASKQRDSDQQQDSHIDRIDQKHSCQIDDQAGKINRIPFMTNRQFISNGTVTVFCAQKQADENRRRKSHQICIAKTHVFQRYPMSGFTEHIVTHTSHEQSARCHKRHAAVEIAAFFHAGKIRPQQSCHFLPPPTRLM